MKRTLKYLTHFLLALLLLLLLAWGLLQTSWAQNKLLPIATDKLSEVLGARVTAEKIRIDFFETVSLDQLTIYDGPSDTLLHAKTTQIDISLFSLWDKKLFIDDLNLDGVKTYLKSKNGIWNYQPIIDHLANNNTPKKEASKQNSSQQQWTFGLDDVRLSDLQFSMLSDSSDLHIGLSALDADFSEFPAGYETFRFNSIDIRGFDLSQIEKLSSGRSSEVSLPNLPFKLTSEIINLKEISIAIGKEGSSSNANKFDPDNILLHLDHAYIKSFALSDTIIGEITNAVLQERSGLDITSLAGKLAISDRHLLAERLSINTEKSLLELSLNSTYESLDELTNSPLSAISTISVEKVSLSRKDILRFVDPRDFPSFDIRQLKRIDFSGIIAIADHQLSLDRAKVDIPQKLQAKGNIAIDTRNNKVNYTANLTGVNTSQKAIQSLLPKMTFPKEINDLGQITGIIKLVGDDNQIRFDRLDITSSRNIVVKGRGKIKNYQNSEKLWLDLEFDFLRGNANDLFNQAADLPAPLFQIGDFEYVGAVQGNAKNINLDGTLKSDIGKAIIDAESQFTADYSNAIYAGTFDLEQFDLGKLLQDTTFGIVTARGTMDGRGLSLLDLDAKLDLTVDRFDFKGRPYRDVVIDGEYKNSAFEGKLKSDDEKIKLDFEGRADLNGTESIFDFKSNIAKLDLTQFGISDSLMWISGIVSGTFKGNNIDNIIGASTINKLRVGTRFGTYSSDSLLSISAAIRSAEEKHYTIQGEFMNGELSGNIKLSELPNILESYFKNYIPVEYGYEDIVKDSIATKADQQFDIDLVLKNINPLIKIFTKDSISVADANFSGQFDSANATIDFKGNFDSLYYNSYLLLSGGYFFDGRREFINGNIIIDRVFAKDNLIIQEADIIASLNNKLADITLELFDQDYDQSLYLGADISRTEDYVVSFHDTLRINENAWIFSPFNQVNWGKSGLFMQDVSLTKDNQGVTAYTDENENGVAIEVLFDNFDINEIFSIVEQNNEYFGGYINGRMVANSIYAKPFFTADLSVDSVTITDNKLGNLYVQALQNSETNTVDTKVRLKGLEDKAELNFAYGISNQQISGALDITSLNIAAIDPFLTQIIKESEGAISGQIAVDGDIQDPQLLGYIALENVETTPVFTNSRYKIENHTIKFNKTGIDLGSMNIFDSQNNTAAMQGKIKFTSFDDMYIDLTVQTEKFQFLKTTPTENPLFYGDVKVKANIFVTGPLDNIIIDGQAEAIDNSKLAISPFSVETVDYETQFIIYADPRKISLDSLAARNLANKPTFPFDVDIKLTVDKDSEFTLVMNPITGDKLTARGEAAFIFQLKQTGEIELFGNYTVTSGDYLFSYGLITKTFAMQPGSKVIFNGDPLEGELDVKAVYSTSTAVYDLLVLELGQEFTDAQKSEAQRRRQVNVVLNLSDEILTPDIDMDIQIPAQDLSSISEILEIKLKELRSNPDELNNQVFGLLLFDSFIVASNASIALTQTGADIAIKSISGLITKQLNNLADGLIKGVELNFDVNSYSSEFVGDGEGGLVTELGVGVSKRLFNDRLTISAGTNIDLESTGSESVFNNIAGDFLLEYKLTEDGRYRIKAFRKSNVDRLIDENSSNKNAVSIYARKEFGAIPHVQAKKNKD